MNPKIKDTGLDSQTLVDLTLLHNSINFLTGEINEESVTNIIKWIVYENTISQDSNKPLTLYINSMGGDLYEAFALIDTMTGSARPIRTIALGSIMSSGFLIFISGRKGQRYITQNCGIMCHQFSDSNEGTKYHDIKASVKEADYCNERMLNIIKNASGMNNTIIKKKLLNSSDVYLKPQELFEMGLVDKILDKRA